MAHIANALHRARLVYGPSVAPLLRPVLGPSAVEVLTALHALFRGKAVRLRMDPSSALQRHYEDSVHNRLGWLG